MNTPNTMILAALGMVMEALPRVFPAWFPPTGADQASARALWLAVMGGVEVAIAAGFLARLLALPLAFRLFRLVRAHEQASIGLPSARGISGR
ncbi:MAG TPA: hypothetical protein VGG34_07775 [Opitutaceae bacterium]|jgi:hypothetical protein